ncbi:MAG: hypothetical protein Satyrvirus29_15 [Satyrvirus sp.]|uniref:Uncharacterized protein n=1 Tax=Satyrvirus sp. TaxID=2487771 RepID=A0A3G5AGE5_9VIRU|nr:MAG: hypothetical protein Satyrvirus29_15 [Satyrvirus sp.]
MESSQCAVCNQPTRLVDSYFTLGKHFHKTCFTCKECRTQLCLRNFTGCDGHPYCKSCDPSQKSVPCSEEQIPDPTEQISKPTKKSVSDLLRRCAIRDPKENIRCIKCSIQHRSEPAPATVFCVQCKWPLCEDCSRSTHTYKINSNRELVPNHELVGINQKPKDIPDAEMAPIPSEWKTEGEKSEKNETPSKPIEQPIKEPIKEPIEESISELVNKFVLNLKQDPQPIQQQPVDEKRKSKSRISTAPAENPVGPPIHPFPSIFQGTAQQPTQTGAGTPSLFFSKHFEFKVGTHQFHVPKGCSSMSAIIIGGGGAGDDGEKGMTSQIGDICSATGGLGGTCDKGGLGGLGNLKNGMGGADKGGDGSGGKFENSSRLKYTEYGNGGTGLVVGGGGGGGYSILKNFQVTAESVLNIEVGSGGKGKTSKSNGGDGIVVISFDAVFSFQY